MPGRGYRVTSRFLSCALLKNREAKMNYKLYANCQVTSPTRLFQTRMLITGWWQMVMCKHSMNQCRSIQHIERKGVTGQTQHLPFHYFISEIRILKSISDVNIWVNWLLKFSPFINICTNIFRGTLYCDPISAITLLPMCLSIQLPGITSATCLPV